MKIKYSLLEKLISLTNREIDFFMFIVRYQEDHGQVPGVYYRDVCQALGICKQTFYNTLQSLKEKGVITYTRSERDHDYDIMILDNDFSYPESYHEGYVNVSRQIFHTKRFRELKAKEKVLLLLFLRITHDNNSSYQIGTNKFYSKYMGLLGVVKRVLQGYLHSLRKFFAIGIKDGKYFITYLASVFNPRLQESENTQKQCYFVKVNCRRSKIKKVEEEEIKSTADLINQYRSYAAESGQNIADLLCSCIYRSTAGKKDTYLSAKTVHWYLRAALGLEKSNLENLM